MENIIKIENLTFAYKQAEEGPQEDVLKQLNIEIEKGSFTAIIGHNGSGKSTLAKNLNALLLPTGGKVYIKGMDTSEADNLWKIRQSAGMVFQNPDNQLVSAIVEDDIAFGPENLGVESKEIRNRVDYALQAVEMYEHRKKAPHLLSGGQKQKIAIAGVIAMKPECVIFDEPTAMLDPNGREDVMQALLALNKEGITVVHITHFMEEVTLADRVIVLDKGIVLFDDQPSEVFQNVEQLKAIGLEVPLVTELAHRLRKKGIAIPKDIVTIEEMVEYICQ